MIHSCLCLPSARITGMHHCTQLFTFYVGAGNPNSSTYMASTLLMELSSHQIWRFLCIYLSVYIEHVCHSVHVENRGQLSGVSSLLLPYRSRGLNGSRLSGLVLSYLSSIKILFFSTRKGVYWGKARKRRRNRWWRRRKRRTRRKRRGKILNSRKPVDKIKSAIYCILKSSNFTEMSWE